jgi:hypothetical protein
MAKQTIGIGASANDGTGDTLRVALDKVNDNFDELYAYRVLGATADATPSEAEVIAVIGQPADWGTGRPLLTSNTNGGVTYYHMIYCDLSYYFLVRLTKLT